MLAVSNETFRTQSGSCRIVIRIKGGGLEMIYCQEGRLKAKRLFFFFFFLLDGKRQKRKRYIYTVLLAKYEISMAVCLWPSGVP